MSKKYNEEAKKPEASGKAPMDMLQKLESFMARGHRMRVPHLLLVDIVREISELRNKKDFPQEPTREMWAAMGDAVVQVHTDHGTRMALHHDLITQAVYKAAWKAAPL